MKLIFYIGSYLKSYIPRFIQKNKMKLLRKQTVSSDIQKRVNYYCKSGFKSDATYDTTIGSYTYTKPSSYHCDLIPYLQYFDKDLKFNYLFGDIRYILANPTIVKSRPISENNENSILFKLNSTRHYKFIKDKKKFLNKKNMLVWRGNLNKYQHHRLKFLEDNFYNPNFNIGNVNDYLDNKYIVDRLSIRKQLDYKFVMSIEGNDVATNLKWILSSNSLCFMSKPKYETWFMEGTLIPNYHYVLIKDDFSDVDEKFKYYIEHTDEALEIIKNANIFAKQFRNKKLERKISLLVLDKYLNEVNK